MSTSAPAPAPSTSAAEQLPEETPEPKPMIKKPCFGGMLSCGGEIGGVCCDASEKCCVKSGKWSCSEKGVCR